MSLVPRKAYVEDAPDHDLDTAIAIVDAPPHAPSPPPAALSQSVLQPVNVFDFLVTEETPNASRISLGGSKEQMRMVEHAPPVFEAGRQSTHELEGDHKMSTSDPAFEKNGYSYGADPVPIIEYRTPGPKHQKNGSRDSIYELDGRDRKSTDKKRKRQQIEELDLTHARMPSLEVDEDMEDAPPVLHSGLTGGLNRLLSKSKFPPSPDYSGGDGNETILISPVKKTRQIKDKERGRPSLALVKVRKVSTSRRTSDESRPRKHHRPHRHEHVEEDRPKRKLKAIEYTEPEQEDAHRQLVVYRTRAELFMSFVTKGPESESGCSINKALKRYHRERGDEGLGLGKAEEEKELWKAIRLRKNERGEIVLFF